MLKKTDSRSGFTIIEVVITIAIGAAVMALVLNAVAGARRSQRNNARANDVNQIASAVNQYIATRNALPTSWANISTIADGGDKFGHYEVASVNAVNSWTTGTPGTVGNFVDASAFAAAGVAGPTTTGSVGEAVAAAADRVVVFTEAGCVDTDKVGPGGIREMAIAYRLEGQTTILCLEI